MGAALLAAVALAAAAPASAAAANPWIERTPLDIAHQGGEDEFPSNTMYAFKRALQVGADMLELDVGVTKDGQVVMHDTTVDRTTDGHGTVASFTLRQLRRLDAAYWFSGGDDADALARALKGTKRRALIVVSFKQEAVDRFHQLRPELPVAPGIGGAANWLLNGGSPGAGVVAFQLLIDDGVDGVMTARPKAFAKLLRERSRRN
jgi:glycerophosphoryl diester phosphodiesterase